MRRTALIVVGLVVLTGALFFAFRYFTYGQYIVSTDDAYVKADTASIAARVSGYVAKVHVEDNQIVHAGDVLVSIDDADYRAALDQANAAAAAQRAALASAEAQNELQQKLMDAAQAKLDSALADQKRASEDLRRARELRESGSGSKQNYDSALADSRKADAAVASATADLAAARQHIVVAESGRAQALANLEAAEAAARSAQINLDHTAIRAPFDGVVGARTVQNGQFVRAGSQLMAVVKMSDVHVVANFKETQAGGMRRGQAVSIHVDAFPDIALHGRIDSFSPATGSEFSLLPPENATGNFTKIVQRLPVKVRLDANEGDTAYLRPGMSVVVSVDTRGEGDGAASVLAPAPRPTGAAEAR